MSIVSIIVKGIEENEYFKLNLSRQLRISSTDEVADYEMILT